MHTFDRDQDVALYIHIPFCPSKCHYCNFAIVTDLYSYDNYLKELKKELLFQLRTITTKGKYVRTVYFGGGTPSTLKISEVKEILSLIYSFFPHNSLAEISFEMNPEHVTEEYIHSLDQLGITRISVGIQTFHEQGLLTCGRVHTKEQSLHALKILQSARMNYSADLILGLPNCSKLQTLSDIQKVLQFQPNHLSIYFLTIEPNTHFQRVPEQWFPVEKDIMKEYEHVCELLQMNGFEHHEVSNWAKNGHVSEHNLMYWRGFEYIGIGTGAGSYFEGKRWTNHKNIHKYNKSTPKYPLSRVEYLSNKDIADTYLMSALRLQEGADLGYVASLVSDEEANQYMQHIQTLLDHNAITLQEKNIVIPEANRVFHNHVVRELL